MVNEDRGFLLLHQYAKAMILSHAAGVDETSGNEHIIDFQSLFKYVNNQNPTLVSSLNSDNPFPGFLPPGRYCHSNNPATDGNVSLLWSNRIYRRPIGDVQIILKANGEVTELNKIEVGILQMKAR